MDLQTRKIAFVQEFLKLQSEEIISKFEKLLSVEFKSAYQENFKPMSIEEFNRRIDKSMDDSKNGRLIEASQLKAKIEQWR